MNNLTTLLKTKGQRITPARLTILEAFSKTREPLDADTVYKKLKRKINEATVYRTLTSFEKTGILKRVDLRKDSTYFEIADEHHHHIVCVGCNEIEDFENEVLEKQLEKIKSSKFRKIMEHSVELFGLCSKCA